MLPGLFIHFCNLHFFLHRFIRNGKFHRLPCLFPVCDLHRVFCFTKQVSPDTDSFFYKISSGVQQFGLCYRLFIGSNRIHDCSFFITFSGVATSVFHFIRLDFKYKLCTRRASCYGICLFHPDWTLHRIIGKDQVFQTAQYLNISLPVSPFLFRFFFHYFEGQFLLCIQLVMIRSFCFFDSVCSRIK